MIISIIAAIENNNGIGYNNIIPWKISDDLKIFKSKTLNHHILMGRKTYDSIGKSLPNRTNIILSSKKINIDNAIVINSLSELYSIPSLNNESELFIAGGSSIYNLFINKADKLYISKIDADVICDSFFPDYSNYSLISEIAYYKNDKNQYNFKFKEYVNDKNIRG